MKIAKPTILVLVGISGSGKSTLEANLIKDYPDIFYKLQQFSTRKMRPGESLGNPYIFVQPKTFELFHDRLIGVIGCQEGSLFKDKYGSIPDFIPGKIATIILADEGIEDLMMARNGSLLSEYTIIVLGLDVDYQHLSVEDRQARAGRDAAFVAKEREVLRHADITYNNGNGKYVDPSAVIAYLATEGVIELDTVAEKVSAA